MGERALFVSGTRLHLLSLLPRTLVTGSSLGFWEIDQTVVWTSGHEEEGHQYGRWFLRLVGRRQISSLSLFPVETSA